MQMEALIAFWLVCAIAVAAIAGSKGRNFFLWLLIALLTSPLIGLILLLALGPTPEAEVARQAQIEDLKRRGFPSKEEKLERIRMAGRVARGEISQEAAEAELARRFDGHDGIKQPAHASAPQAAALSPLPQAGHPHSGDFGISPERAREIEAEERYRAEVRARLERQHGHGSGGLS